MSKNKLLNGITFVYIEIIRGAPMLLQLYFFWLWLPKAMPFEMSERDCILVALIINSSAYIAEIIRAGIQAVDKGQTEAVKTVTVKATLIVSTALAEEDVYNITKAIFDNVDAITAAHAKGAELSLENATSGMTVPFHAGAAKYFAEKGVNVETK